MLRALAVLAVVLATPVAAAAQSPPKVGYLSLDLTGNPRHEWFSRGMRDLGYVEGRNVVVEYRNAEGRPERLDGFAAELVALQVDVLVAPGALPAAAAKRATTRTIPIVTVVSDPVSEGLVSSLARPGGNVTGVANIAGDLVGKSLQLLKQVVPDVGRVAVLKQPGAASRQTEKDFGERVEAAARALAVDVQFVEARRAADIDEAFAKVSKGRAGALVVAPYSMFLNEKRRIAGLAAKMRLPAVYVFRESVDAGGLMSYGPDLADSFRRSASYVDRILKGARPADLPVEQPTKFELIINLKTAKALGLTIPPSVLQQADQLIQ